MTRRRIYRREDRGTAGAEGDGVRGGVSPPHWGEVSGGAMPPPEKNFDFGSQNGATLAALCALFLQFSYLV